MRLLFQTSCQTVCCSTRAFQSYPWTNQAGERPDPNLQLHEKAIFVAWEKKLRRTRSLYNCVCPIGGNNLQACKRRSRPDHGAWTHAMRRLLPMLLDWRAVPAALNCCWKRGSALPARCTTNEPQERIKSTAGRCRFESKKKRFFGGRPDCSDRPPFETVS